MQDKNAFSGNRTIGDEFLEQVTHLMKIRAGGGANDNSTDEAEEDPCDTACVRPVQVHQFSF